MAVLVKLAILICMTQSNQKQAVLDDDTFIIFHLAYFKD